MAVSNRLGDDLLYEALLQNEGYMHEVANTIDTKASQIFAAAAFLAVQPAVVLVQPGLWHRVVAMQLLATVGLFVAFIYAHLALRITEYAVPGFADTWRAEIIDKAGPGATDDEVRGTLLWGLIQQTQKRIDTGDGINKKKLDNLTVARWATMVALSLNVVTLVLLALTLRAS
jgi:hypothetical protein